MNNRVAHSLQNLIRLHRHRFDALTEHDDFPFSPAIACLGEFEAIGAAQYPATRCVAIQCEAGAGNGVVQKLQIFSGAGASSGFAGEFEDADAVQPEPAACAQDHQYGQTREVHVVSPLVETCCA